MEPFEEGSIKHEEKNCFDSFYDNDCFALRLILLKQF